MKNLHSQLKPGAFLALVTVVLCALAPSSAHAGGLYLFDRGARALSRGGAFVAGADDPQSLWYNPAGLIDSKNQILSDATMSFMLGDYQRITLGPDGQEYTYAAVKPKATPIPIPTLAISHNFGLKKFVFGAGVFAPNTIVLNWPQSVRGPYGSNDPAPTRYSLKGLKGSILANLALGVAWNPIGGLNIGADVQVVVGRFQVEQSLSSCDGFICRFPEDPSFDANAVAKLPTVAVTGVFGATYDMKILRLGASLMLPYKLKGDADLDITLPSNAIFNDARLSGPQKGYMEVNFPMIIRIGSELRPIKAIRMEGTFVLEKWSTQKEIELDARGLRITNVTGIQDYDLGPVTVQRKMRDTWSLRGGSELFIPRRWSPWGLKWVLRGGIAYEKSAFGSSTTTPLTLDFDKFILSGGFGVNLHKRVRFDTVLGYVFMKDRKVRDSEITQPQAIRPTDTANATALGNGNYDFDALFLGGGFAFDLN